MDAVYSTIGTIATPLVAGLSKIFGRGGADVSKREQCTGIHTRVLATHPTTPNYAANPNTAIEILGKDDLNGVLEMAEQGSNNLYKLSASERAQLARQCARSCAATSKALVDETIRHKGSYETGRGEEMGAWSSTVWGLRQIAESLETIASSGSAGLIRQASRRISCDGHKRTKAVLFPQGFYEHLLFSGYSGEVWLEGDAPRIDNPMDRPAAATYFLLAAGNQATAVGGDVTHLVFAVGCAVICKLNPVNQYLKKHLEDAFSPLVELGIVQFCYLDVPESQKLIYDPRIDGIHMTGSDATYDVIQFGPKPSEQLVTSLPEMIATKKKRNEVNLNKPFSAELGCCTPYIVCPGNWTQSDMQFHARAIVSACVNNGHYNCLAVQNILVSESWPQREDFMATIKKHLKVAQCRSAYYPGSPNRLAKFCKVYSEYTVSQFSHFYQQGNDDDTLPWTVIEGISSESDVCDYTCKNEAFTSLITEITIPSTSSTEFLKKAVKFCNEKMWGTLSCSIFIPPQFYTREKTTCEEAIANLKYGSVCVNVPTLAGYLIKKCSWGGYGNVLTPTDIESGTGKVHNTMLLANVEKSVIRAPWTSPVTPLWFYDNANLEAAADVFVRFVLSPNLFDLILLVFAAIFG